VRLRPPKGEGPAAEAGGADGGGQLVRGPGKSEKTRPGGAGACTGCILRTLRSCALVREINEVDHLCNNCKSYEVTEQLNKNCESYEVTEQVL